MADFKKIKSKFIIDIFKSGAKSYAAFTKEVGLWDSEKYVFEKYIEKTDTILDLGCGAGRTTFPLFDLGYKDITGIDLTPEMIYEANDLSNYFGSKIEFKIGDATDLKFPDATFNVVLFSFNGLMTIPGPDQRECAIQEINRVLTENGIFIFTTLDREQEEVFLEFWEEQKKIWDNGLQDHTLYEFGDIITFSKKENRDIYIHVPNQEEIRSLLTVNNFELVETFYRSDKFDENEKVKAKAGECRFWIVRKKPTHKA